MAVVRQIIPTTPQKHLATASNEPSEKSDTDAGMKRTGRIIDDDVKLAFLVAWIKQSEVPFFFNLSKHKSTKAKNAIEEILKYLILIY